MVGDCTIRLPNPTIGLIIHLADSHVLYFIYLLQGLITLFTMATATTSPARQPPLSPPTIYHILLGLSIMTLGTISFCSFSLSLPDWRASLLESTSAGYPGTLRPPIHTIPAAYQAPICGLTPNLDEFTSLIHLLEAQVRELQDLTKQCATIIADNSHLKSSALSPGDYEGMIGYFTGLLALLSKFIGLNVLHNALERISQAHWLRAIALGILGANLGVVWTLMGTWDRLMLFGLAGLDIGCVIGGVLAFGETA